MSARRFESIEPGPEKVRSARGYVALVAAYGLAVAISVAAADERAVRKKFDIPVQPLDAALIEFSIQSDIQVLTDAELVAGLSSTSIEGYFVPQDALALLISGSDLTFEALDTATVVISRDVGLMVP